MNLSKKMHRVINKVGYKLFLKKRLYQSFSSKITGPKTVLLIIWCQRSGTTMKQRIFERDLNAQVYGEFSKLSAQDTNKIRLNPLHEVRKVIEAVTPPLVVLKPIVETQKYRKINALFSRL